MTRGTGVTLDLWGKECAEGDEWGVLLQLFLRVDGPETRDIGIREAGNRGDIVSRAKLRTITAEVLDDVSAVAKEKHDVAKIARVVEPQGVTELVQAGQIDNGIAQEIVRSGASRDIGAERFDVGPYKNGGSAPAVHQKRLGFAIFTAAGFGPIKANERGGFGGRFEMQTFARVALPRLEGPESEFAVAWTITGAGFSVSDKIGDGTFRILRQRDARLQGSGPSCAPSEDQQAENGHGGSSSNAIRFGHMRRLIGVARSFMPTKD